VATDSSNPLSGPTVIQPEDAEAYLRRMDIDVDEVFSAIEAGEIAAGNITLHHPVTAAGLTRWIQVVGRLREQLSRRGWQKDDPRGRPVSDHPKMPYGLSTVGGTDATGIADHPSGPLAARKKGIATAEAVTNQLPLITIEVLRKPPTVAEGSAPPSGNWFLLYYRADNGQVRLEISLPLGFDDGQFTGWRVRVILPPWERPDPAATNPRDIGGQDVDFEVGEVA